MFSKLIMGLAITTSLISMSNVYAQAKKTTAPKKATAQKPKKATVVQEVKKDEDDKAAIETAAKKAEEAKVLEAKRAEEAKAAEKKASVQASSTGTLGYIRSHFSASYHGEYYFVRKDIDSPIEDDHDLQDLKIMHNPTIIYRPVPNVKLLATSELKYTDAEKQGSFINRHHRSLITLTRENVMTEAEDGVKLDLGVGRRITDRNHSTRPSYGNSRYIVTVGKKLTSTLSTSMLAQYMINDPVYSAIDGTTWRHALNIIPSFTWQITDKLSYFFNDDMAGNTPFMENTDSSFYITHDMNIGVFAYQFNDSNSSYLQLKYLREVGAPFQAASKVTDSFDYYIGHTYSFTPKLSITGEVGSNVIKAHDGKSLFSEAIKYPEFAIYLDASI